MSEPAAPPAEPQFLKTLEDSLATILYLIPDVLRTCALYLARPATFLRRVVATESDPIAARPYAFVAITSIAAAVVVRLELAFANFLGEELGNAFTMFGPPDGVERLQLMRQIEHLEKLTLAEVLVQSVPIVVAVVALSRLVARLIARDEKHRTQLESTFSYVAGAQQVHAVVLIPVTLGALMFAFAADRNWLLPIAFVTLAAHFLAWPAMLVHRAAGRIDPEASFRRRLVAGVLVAVVNPLALGALVTGIDMLPRAVPTIRSRFLEVRTPVDFRIPYSFATIDSAGRVRATVAIEVLANGRSLVADFERATTARTGFSFFERYERHKVALLDSSDGTRPVLLVLPGQTKWFVVEFGLDDSDLTSYRHDTEYPRRISFELDLGTDILSFDNVEAQDASGANTVK